MAEAQENKSTQGEQEIQDGRFFAVISYISFLCILSLLLKKENKFAVYHAKHGLVLFVFEVVAFIFSMVPLLGWLLRVLGTLAFVLASLWGIMQSFNGNYSRIPLVSRIADNIVL